MAKRIVQKTFTFEEQRQEINLLADDVGDIQDINTVGNTSVVDSFNEIIATPIDDVFLEDNDSENADKPIVFAQNIVLEENYATVTGLDPATNPNDLDYAQLGYDSTNGVYYNPSTSTVKAGNFQGDIKNTSGEVVLDTGTNINSGVGASSASYTGFLKTKSTNPGIDINNTLMTLAQSAAMTLNQGSEINLTTGTDIGASINVTNSSQVIYVNAQDENASDASDNNGRNINRPFKSIERALLEASSRSFVAGLGTEEGEVGADKFEFFSIILFPGLYEIDNRPGVTDLGTIQAQNSSAFATTAAAEQELYKFNSVRGGVIVPRGTSIVGLDLRKTIIRPKYVPTPNDGDILNRSAIFRLTGGCYIWQFTIKDKLEAEYSHHKLTGFEYADYDDLELYYEKVDIYSTINDPLADGPYDQRVEENRIVGFVQNKYLSDTVASASPYVFNISLRSVWGMCGLNADGARATGLRSMVLAQYTGISLQRDDRAFSLNGSTTTNVDDELQYHANSSSVYRDEWRHYHIKCCNNSFLQVVSVFAVGQADHFLAETGGDMSITNSNSNFGNKSVICVNHRPDTFKQDSGGYIIGVVPPRGIDPDAESNITISEIDFKSTLKKYDDVLTNFNADIGDFRKIYVKLDGETFVKESDIPEYYTKNQSGVETKAELLLDDVNYLLGKRRYATGRKEGVYAKLGTNPNDASIKTWGAALRDNHSTSVTSANSLDPADIVLFDPETTYNQGILTAASFASALNYGQVGTKENISSGISGFTPVTTILPTTLIPSSATPYPTLITATTNTTAQFQTIFTTSGGNQTITVELVPAPVTKFSPAATSGTPVAGYRSYLNKQPNSTSGTGSGLVLDIDVVGSIYVIRRIVNPGNNFKIGNTVTFNGAQFDGVTGTNNLILTITGIQSCGDNYQVNDTLNIRTSSGGNSVDIEITVTDVIRETNFIINTNQLEEISNYELNGDGYDAEFVIDVIPDPGNGPTALKYAVNLIQGGSGFKVNDTISIPKTFFNTSVGDVFLFVESVTGETIPTKNAIRQFYGWEYSRTVNGEKLGRLAILIDDSRTGGSNPVYGIPTQFNYNATTYASVAITGFVDNEPEYPAQATRLPKVYQFGVSNITYNQTTSQATVTTTSNHNFYIGDIISISGTVSNGTDPNYWNLTNLEIVDITANTFKFELVTTSTPPTILSGTGTVTKSTEELTIDVKVAITVSIVGQTTVANITAIYPNDFDLDATTQNYSNWTTSGSGLVTGDQLVLNTGSGTALPTTSSTTVVFTVANTFNDTGRLYQSENIKERNYLPSSSIGTRYNSYDTTTDYELQTRKSLSLLRRITQRADTNEDGNTTGDDRFEFTENSVFNLFVKRIQDSRNSFGAGELTWRLLYKVPKDGFSDIKLRGPEEKFTIQLKDPAIKFPFTYDTSPSTQTKYPKSFYVSKVDPITEYRYNQQDGYYLLTILDGNVFTDESDNNFTNKIVYGDQRLIGLNGNDIDHIAQDASDSIESNKTFIQKEASGYLKAKYSNISTTLTSVGTLVTATTSYAHNYVTGNTVTISGATFSAPATSSPYNGNYVVTVTGPTTFTYTASSTPATPTASGSITASFYNPNEQKCKRDIGYVINAVTSDLRTGGNAKTFDAATFYFNAANQLAFIDGELVQSIDTYNYARNLSIAAMRNWSFYTTGYSTSGSAIIRIPSTLGVVAGMKVTQVSVIPTPPVGDPYANLNSTYEQLSGTAPNQYVTPKATNVITTAIPATAYVKRVISATEIELGTASSLPVSGGLNTVNATATDDIFFHFQLITGRGENWASPEANNYPSVNFTLKRDYNENITAGRFIDAGNLITSNRQEIIDRGFGEIAIQYNEAQWGDDWKVPGNTQPAQINRYYDAYRLVQKNRNIIVETAYKTVNDNPPSPAPANLLAKCKRDIGLYIDAVTLDILNGDGNRYTRKFIQQYFDSGTGLLNLYLNGEVTQSNTAFNKAKDAIKAAITNTLSGLTGLVTSSPYGGTWVDGSTGTLTVYTDLTIEAGPATFGGGGGNIANNSSSACADVRAAVDTLTLLITSSLSAGNINGANALPPETIGFADQQGETICKRDLGYLVDAVSEDIATGGNAKIITVAKEYFPTSIYSNDPNLSYIIGEEAPSVFAFNAARDMMKKAVTNQLYSKNLSLSVGPASVGGTGGNITYTASGNSATCIDVQNAIDTEVLILTRTITEGDISSLTDQNDPNYVAVTYGDHNGIYGECASATYGIANYFELFSSIVTGSLPKSSATGRDWAVVRKEPTRGTYTINDVILEGFGYAQNINYLYPEVDLDNPKWNPKAAESRWNENVGNCVIRSVNLSTDNYERVTQYSITAESVRNFLTQVLTGGDYSPYQTVKPDIQAFGALNIPAEFGVANESDLTVEKFENPYLISSYNDYGVNKSAVLEFNAGVPTFTERCITFGVPVPVSLYRPSIIRASGHTWEYVGFGPGNYSTALPQFQDVNLNVQQRVNSQTIERAGGFSATSGTNSFGDFYIGNQVIDTKGNATNTLNFPKVKTSAENRLINFNDDLSKASNSSASSFNPSSFSKVLTENLSALQEAQRNAFKAANIESANSTFGSIKITGRISIANSVFDNTNAFPDARRDEYGFVKRASLNWYNNEPGSEEFDLLENSYISPPDLIDWANKNSLIPSSPVTWEVYWLDTSDTEPGYAPEGLFNDASVVGQVNIENTFKKSANFIVEGIDPVDERWYDATTNTLSIPLGTPLDFEKGTGILDYEGRAGLIFISFPQSVNASAIIPTNIWKPVDNNWNGISAEDGSPTTYLTGRYFLVGYYVSAGRILYTTNVINI